LGIGVLEFLAAGVDKVGRSRVGSVDPRSGHVAGPEQLKRSEAQRSRVFALPVGGGVAGCADSITPAVVGGVGGLERSGEVLDILGEELHSAILEAGEVAL